MLRLLKYAAYLSNKKGGDDRNFRLAAVGQRNDGAIVHAYNEATQYPNPEAHAEFRLTRKLDAGATVYVARTHKDGTLAMAKPCESCETMLRNRRVKRVYYTTGPNTWECMELKR